MIAFSYIWLGFFLNNLQRQLSMWKPIISYFFCLFTFTVVQAQPKRICVMGSSTAYGYFPNTSIPRDSAWAFKISKYYKDRGIIDTLYNIATPGIDCYIGMPTGYTPPANRNAPNPAFNITKAVNFDPPPDVIIINFPSNGYSVFSETEIIQCLQTMKDYANARNIRCYITTTQPRNDFVQQVEREKLRSLKNLIETTFGAFSIDFWTDIVQDPPIIINPVYNLGDGVHLTPEGHTLLKNRVIQRDIFFQPVALNLGILKVAQHQNHALVSFKIDGFEQALQCRLERSMNAINNFDSITEWEDCNWPGNQRIYLDGNPAIGNNFYRMAIKSANEEVYYSQVIRLNFKTNSMLFQPYIFPNPSTGSTSLVLPPSEKEWHLNIYNEMGNVVKRVKLSSSLQTSIFKLELPHHKAGKYFIQFPGKDINSIPLIRL